MFRGFGFVKFWECDILGNEVPLFWGCYVLGADAGSFEVVRF